MFFAIANTVVRQVGGAIVPPPPYIPFIWNLDTNTFGGETRVWNYAVSWEAASNNWESETENWEII